MLHYTMNEAKQDWTSAPRMYIWKHPTQADKEPEITYDEANRAEAIGHHHDYSIITGAMSLASSMIEINGVRYIRQYRDNRTPGKFYGDPAIVLWRVDDVKQALTTSTAAATLLILAVLIERLYNEDDEQ